LENVMLPILYDLRANDPHLIQKQRAAAALESVGLGNRLHHHPNQLSGGQQQRVAIARALINHPPIILADEPTGNLDSRSSEEILDLLHQLHQQGTTIVLVTHEPEVARHAQRIVWVHDGKVVSDRRDHVYLDRSKMTQELVI
jgi:putative ABC transport system ATP-binding protein